jgi:hypothetical protein
MTLPFVLFTVFNTGFLTGLPSSFILVLAGRLSPVFLTTLGIILFFAGPVFLADR